MSVLQLDPIASFHQIKKKYQDAFFFESEKLSVIGLDHEEVIRLVGGQLEVEKNNSTQLVEKEFLLYLSEKLEELKCESSFPFQHGGMFGCLGYEIVSLIEPRLKSSGYFKSLDNGDEVMAEMFLSFNLIIFDHLNNKIHFSLKDKKINPSEFLVSKRSSSENPPVHTVDFSSTNAFYGRELFLKSVEKIKSHIRAGDIFQAVLSERFERKSFVSSLDLFFLMKRKCPSAYSFYFDFKESSFFGASPEALLKVSQGEMETHPIAGTRPRGIDLKADELLEKELYSSEKEGAEHLMLVDLARNDLGRVAKAGTVVVEGFRQLLKLTNVMHLVSIVKAKKRSDKNNLEAMSSCFPAGTLSGAPKIRAMEILSELETIPRGLYGGAVVAFDHGGDLDSCIAIRSLEVKEGKVILRAGAGIVADSDPESEYQEIQDKLKGLLQVIELAEEEQLSLTQVIA